VRPKEPSQNWWSPHDFTNVETAAERQTVPYGGTVPHHGPAVTGFWLTMFRNTIVSKRASSALSAGSTSNMLDIHTSISTADGDMGTFVSRPADSGPHPVVFFYMDAPGKREELHDMARRIATTGYYVVLPQLYYRRVEEYWRQDLTAAARAEMFEHMNSLSNAMVVSDTQALFDHIDADPAADSSKVGCVGYCMSGPFSLTMASAYPDRISCAASIYGVRLAVDAHDSPHKGFDKVQGELYIACAETDEYAPPEMVALVEEALAASGAAGSVEWYPGSHHGFAFPDRSVYNKAAAEVHWRRLHSLFDRNLRAG
jgi:carboxymethylenebutenolidase